MLIILISNSQNAESCNTFFPFLLLFSLLRPFLYYLTCLFTSPLFIHVTSHFPLEMGLIYILFFLSLSLSLSISPLIYFYLSLPLGTAEGNTTYGLLVNRCEFLNQRGKRAGRRYRIRRCHISPPLPSCFIQRLTDKVCYSVWSSSTSHLNLVDRKPIKLLRC